jgi:hypothetical protein
VWNGKKHQVKALLEPPELVLRGDLRHRIPFSKISSLKADGEFLALRFEGASIRLQLGGAMAARWADAILKPPPTLAKKLGISRETTMRTIGPIDDAALKAALAEAKAVSRTSGDLILARVDTLPDLRAALAKAAAQLASGIPIWFIYRKGPGHPLSENQVRDTALPTGIVDTKVASVSPEFSALRFVKRRP